MKPFSPQHSRQRGAIAVMTGLLMLLVLLPVTGLVLDLGHLYIVKSELQNAADAAALAAGKDLDNTTAGVNKAVATGKAITLLNKYNFNTTLTLLDNNFEFGPDPAGPWYSLADTQAAPNGRTFVRVCTKSGGCTGTPQSIDTYVMRVAGRSTTETFGEAVAGRFVNQITPIGVCAVDPTHRTANYTYSTGITEVVEFGFRRGVAYNVFSLGSLGGANSDPYQINPVNSPPGACQASNASAATTAPFMCAGSSAVLPTGFGQVYTNTGMTASLDKALNSRFNDYGNGSQCDPVSAPPDVNVREYPCRKGATDCVTNAAATVTTTPPISWMDTSGATYPNTPAVAVTTVDPFVPKYRLPGSGSTPVADATATYAQFADYGPLWAYTPAMQSNGITPITPAEANATQATAGQKMYGDAPGSYFDTAVYPSSVGTGFPTGTVAAPYNQTGNANFFLAPTGRPGVIDRRILNIVLIDCRTPPSAAQCGTMTAVGIGKFFMLTKANFGGSPKRLDVEFTGLIEPVPTSEVKLFK